MPYIPQLVKEWIEDGAETDELVEAYHTATADLAELGTYPGAFLTLDSIALITAELAKRSANPFVR